MRRISSEKDCLRNKYGALRVMAVAVLGFLLVSIVMPVFAWLYFQKSIQTLTQINAPNALIIGAGNAYAIRQLELSNIDVSVKERYKDVVFCVYSASRFDYHLQLGHTTNIGFHYTIYPATKVESGGDVEYLGDHYEIGKEGNTFKPLTGGYLNKIDGNTLLANSGDNYHDKTYAKAEGSAEHYDTVQKNANPLYWKTDEKSPMQFPTEKDGDLRVYINYYVLRISWDSSVVNNKETDMVYLMAEAANSGN